MFLDVYYQMIGSFIWVFGGGGFEGCVHVLCDLGGWKL